MKDYDKKQNNFDKLEFNFCGDVLKSKEKSNFYVQAGKNKQYSEISKL